RQGGREDFPRELLDRTGRMPRELFHIFGDEIPPTAPVGGAVVTHYPSRPLTPTHLSDILSNRFRRDGNVFHRPTEYGCESLCHRVPCDARGSRQGIGLARVASIQENL